jgi:hypothetical protein
LTRKKPKDSGNIQNFRHPGLSPRGKESAGRKDPAAVIFVSLTIAGFWLFCYDARWCREENEKVKNSQEG